MKSRLVPSCLPRLPRRLSLVLGSLGAAVLTACGGGSGSSTVEQLNVNGVAAVGAALSGASVEVKCASGTPQAGQVTEATGSYRVLLNGAKAPCMVEVRGGTVGGAANTLTLHGYAGEAGKAHVTTLTELVLARALGASPAAAFGAFDGSAVPSAQALSEALDYVGAQFAALGLGVPTAAVLNGSFVIGQGDDLLLDALNEKLADSNVDVGTLVAATASSAAWTEVVLRNCSSTTLSWTQDGNTCAADVPLTASAVLVQLTDTQAPATGSASYTCTNGQWGQPADAVCTAPPPAPCSAQSVNWSVDGNTCGALLGEAASGVSSVIEDTSAPTTGSATYVCRDGSWGSATNVSCAVPSPCGAQAMSWTVNGNTCTASVNATASGALAAATDAAAPTTGSATFACTNGNWGAAMGATCNVPTACTSQAMSWTVNGNTCTGSAAGTASGASSVATDADAPTTGAATFACTNGAWGAAANATCNVPVSGACTAQSMNWTVNGNLCSAAVADTASGASALATDATAPTTGAATFSCTNGSWSGASNASCTQPSPCTDQTLSWTVNGNTCSAAVSGVASGLSASGVDAVGPATGAASFSCTNGSWGNATNASCTVPPACTTQGVSWTVNGNTCSATLAGTASGGSATATDATAPTTGSAVYACSNGAWGSPTSASCSTPLACSAQTVSWTVGGNTCQGTLAGVASGASSVADDGTIPTVGSATYACTNGSWGSPTASACTLAPTGPRTFTLNLEADAGGRWYEYYSDAFGEVGRAYNGSAVNDGFFQISALPNYVTLGGGFDVFPKNASFGDIGTVTYNITGYTGSGVGTAPVTALAANFTTVIAPKATVQNLDYATTFTNVTGTVSLYDGQVTGITVTATVTFTYTTPTGTQVAFSGPFQINTNRFSFTAGDLASPGDRKYRWEFSGQVKNLATGP